MLTVSPSTAVMKSLRDSGNTGRPRVSLQNGLNEELIARAVGAERTVGCLVNWAADWTAPGRILHGGEGALVLGELDGRLSDRVQQLAKLLEVVAPTNVSRNVLGYTWAKHVYGALLVATAVVDAHVYEVVERSPEVQRMLAALVIESMHVAEAAGIRLEPFDEYAPDDYRAAARGDAAALARAMKSIATHYRAATKPHDVPRWAGTHQRPHCHHHRDQAQWHDDQPTLVDDPGDRRW